LLSRRGGGDPKLAEARRAALADATTPERVEQVGQIAGQPARVVDGAAAGPGGGARDRGPLARAGGSDDDQLVVVTVPDLDGSP
jgi:hypothetical protein